MLPCWTRKPFPRRKRSSVIPLFILFTVTAQLVVTESLAQQADFTVNVTSGCLPLTVNFTDISTGTITSWTWNFGNGNGSNFQHPGATYNTAGTYTVSLTVSNGSQSDTETKTGLIIVHGFPIPDFSIPPNQTSGCAPLGVAFTDKTDATAGAIADRLWVFGDGGTSSSVNPVYVYNGPGDMPVSLTVKNVHGCERTKIISTPIHVLGPTTDFSVNKTSICELPSTFQFTDESTGTGTLTYAWTFGDNFTSNIANPQHAYANAGTYTVIETVTDANGCRSSHSMNVNAGYEGGLDFQLSTNQLCLQDGLSFNVQANSSITSYQWDFGNNTSSNEANPTISYVAPGNYSITLIAKLQNNLCFSRVVKTVEVLEQPNTSYTYAIDCEYNVAFKNTTPNIERVEWYIDGVFASSLSAFEYAFNLPGSHQVALIAFNRSGCQKMIEQTVSLSPALTASFLPDQLQDCLKPSLSGCAPFSLQFANTSTSSSAFNSVWSFGDGDTSTEKEPLHVFGKGTFIVTLTIKNAEGCTSSASTLVNVVNTAPTADFTIDKISVCAQEDVTFTDQSLNANFWCWDFGDGSTGVGSKVTHAYTHPGVYTVILTSKNAGCVNTKSKVVTVKDPYVAFGVIKSCSTPFTVGLQNFSENYHSLTWDFGDGNTSNTDVTSHTYAALGSYNVELTAVNTATHCVTKVTVPVLIQKIKADFEIDDFGTNNATVCKNTTVKFKDKSTSAVQWAWSLGNATSGSQNTSTVYQNAGPYQVTLTSFNSDGCPDQKTIPVNVLGLEGKFDFTASSNCDEFTVKFKDRSLGTPSITGWSWDFGDGDTSPNTNPVHPFRNPGKYSVKLTITNNEGTCSFIKEDAVTFNLPIPNFITPIPVACINKPMYLISTSLRAEKLYWDLGDGHTSSSPSTQVAYSSIGKYDITLYATDKYGCTKSLTKPAFLSVSKPTAAFDVNEKNGACPPFTSFFKNKSDGDIINWRWDFGDGKKSALADPANTYVKPGDYDVKLSVIDKLGCADETTVKNFIHVGGPSGSFVSDRNGIFCTGKTVSFTASTINTVTHRWDFGDGSIVDISGTQANHLYPKKGNFTIDLTLIDGNGCKIAADENMKITVSDTSRIKVESLPNCIFSGDTIALTASSESDQDLLWSWGMNGSSVGTGARLQTTIEESGDYALKLTATNSRGCVSNVPYQLSVQDHLNFIPNVITPNNDGLNDTFKIDKINNGQWNFTVYNRWGIPVYTDTAYQGNWNGGNLDAGVYYFNIQNMVCADKNYKGPVSIIR